MPHNPRLQLLQHLPLLIVVLLEKRLLAPAGVPRPCVGRGVEVDGDGARVVDGADEVVDGGIGGEGEDLGGVGGADEL